MATDRLTPREIQVVSALHDGLSCPQIALRLGIAERTVRRYVENIAAKLPGKGPPIRRIVANARKLLEAA